ncbi:MAG: four helix bundle protein [Verrucomicrobia bacterium 13_2_20CM_55_10]|nr:MAG: four helix bundle protein [Verrucomicrobia bacterium 13_2_20CM_55_10]
MYKRELQDRTRRFALRVLKLVDVLPSTAAGRAISNQLVRSATSVGANYRAACRARSRAEFVAKLGTVLEEADESLYWLELIRDAKLVSEHRISLLLREADELTAIVVTGRKSATKKQNI